MDCRKEDRPGAVRGSPRTRQPRVKDRTYPPRGWGPPAAQSRPTSADRTQELHRFRLAFHSVAAAGTLFEGPTGPTQRSIQAQSKSSGNLPSTEPSSEISLTAATRSHRKVAIAVWASLGRFSSSFKEPLSELLNHNRLGSHVSRGPISH